MWSTVVSDQQIWQNPNFTMDTILFTLEIIEYIIVRDGLVIRNEPFIFITVKANERACRHLQKNDPDAKNRNAKTNSTVEWAKVHRANLLRDAAPVRTSILSSRSQKHRLFKRNLAWKSTSSNLGRKFRPRSNSVRGFVRSRNNLGRLGLQTLT